MPSAEAVSPSIQRGALGAFSLSELELHHVAELGILLRERTANAPTTRLVAERLVALLFERLRDEHARALPLVRAYVTRPYSRLSPALQEFAQKTLPEHALTEETPCLTLLATRGLEPAWNDVERSKGHRTIPLPSAAAVERFPMVSHLLAQLGLEVQHLVDPARSLVTDTRQRLFNAFHVPVARGSVHVPAQSDFVERYGIESVFGFGTVLPHGAVFAVVAFTTTPVSLEKARLFETLALYTKLALLGTREMQASLPERALVSARAATFEQVLHAHEANVLRWGRDWTTALEASRSRVESLSRARERELERHNQTLERTHQTRLGMLEELRAARTTLEERVTERTAELAELSATLLARNQELEEFVYIASHDLQEPLRTMAGYLQLLERRYEGQLDAEADELIELAVGGAHRMQALLDGLLTYSRVSTKGHAFERLSLDAALDAAIENLALAIEQSGARIERSALPEIWADRVQMVQLFQNLLVNAIESAGDAPPRIELGAERDGASWKIWVRDHGVGFDPNYTDGIFEIFRRLSRKTPGTGIGLAICKKIVERHGGHIGADSTPGEGATFTLHLPAGKSHGR